MLRATYKNQVIVLVQKSGKVSAKVGGVTVVTGASTADQAIHLAKCFIDSLNPDQSTDG